MNGLTAPRLARGRLAGLRVLIAEDSWIIADTLAVILEEEGVHVIGPVPTNSGAIDLLRQEKTDFALVDMSLKDGFADELTQELYARSIPYAIITAFEALPSNAGDHAVAVFRKPVSRKLLVEILSGYTDPKR